MSHALTAISASAATAYMLSPPTGAGGWQAGLFFMALLAGIGAMVMGSFDK